MSKSHPLMRARNVHKSYRMGRSPVPVLGGVDLAVEPGEFLAVVGQSGSGKTTLLHLLALLDTPDQGEIELDGVRIDDAPESARDRLRNRAFGVVFQVYHLLPELTVLENALLPELVANSWLGWFRRRHALRRRAEGLLDDVGLSHRLHHRPRELSGGETQRAAIVRAILHRPRILFADEPTGNLDESSGRQVLAALDEMRKRERLTVVMVTHNPEIAASADRVVCLSDGRLETADSGTAPRGAA